VSYTIIDCIGSTNCHVIQLAFDLATSVPNIDLKSVIVLGFGMEIVMCTACPIGGTYCVPEFGQRSRLLALDVSFVPDSVVFNIFSICINLRLGLRGYLENDVVGLSWGQVGNRALVSGRHI
jgi:hypothetical protein